jgi:hypothetical protein
MDDRFGRCRSLHRGAVRNLVRDPQRESRVLAEEVQRLGASRLADQLGAEVCGSDCIGLRDDGGTACLAPADGERQPEGKDQPDQAEERGLQNADRLAEGLVVPPEIAADEGAGNARTSDARDEDERDGLTRERKEHCRDPMPSRASSARRRGLVRIQGSDSLPAATSIRSPCASSSGISTVRVQRTSAGSGST